MLILILIVCRFSLFAAYSI